MWEHAAVITTIPSAIVAVMEIFDRVLNEKETPEGGIEESKRKLGEINAALETFAADALELAALKQLHATTNRFNVDLRHSFGIILPDANKSRSTYDGSLELIKSEFQLIWERGGAEFAKLRDDPLLMQFLTDLPQDVMERVPELPWDQYFWQLLRDAGSECGNFDNFYTLIEKIRVLNSALNSFADRNIARGIDEFDDIMDKLRLALSGMKVP